MRKMTSLEKSISAELRANKHKEMMSATDVARAIGASRPEHGREFMSGAPQYDINGNIRYRRSDVAIRIAQCEVARW